jgi:hypothetical protein
LGLSSCKINIFATFGVAVDGISNLEMAFLSSMLLHWLALAREGRMSSKDSSERHLRDIFRGLTPVNYPSSVMPK